MLLNEIFDTRNKVTWQAVPNGFEGQFDVDGEKYILDIEAYDLDLPSGSRVALDVGFRKGQSSKLTSDQKPARVLGSVLAGLKDKITELKPNIIMFGAVEKNGEVQKRKELYARLASLMTKTTDFYHLSRWYAFDGGEYAFMADFNPSEEDEKAIERLASFHK